jgi:hypothetical protein
MFHKLIFVGGCGFVVRDVHAIATDEPDTQHRSRHVIETRRRAHLAA